MKKTFNLKDTKHKPERQADQIKKEIKKYLGRERRKETPDKVDYWDFDCKIGDTVETAADIEVQDINAKISTFVSEDKESFYLEILAKPGFKGPKRH